MADGAVGGTAPNTTEAVPRNLQVPFSCAHNLYWSPATVMVLVAACAFSAPNHASTVAAATPRSFKFLVIVNVYR
ncbi:hypothetical protein A8H39_37375 [Paraburkholderia fungorum]|jgi:hypothetical protein|nr:hypothetical protein [Paraburkholderia fungorum]PNE54193.1 hypothetical protein A8H39_37375 [Paraburkholderia fungorum]